MFSTSFMVGAVGGPAVGSLTAGWGLTAPFIVYGVALLGVAVVLFFSLRHSALAAPGPPTRSTVTMREALRYPRLSVGIAVQLRDRLVGVRAARRAGPAVHHRRHGPRRRRHRRGAGGVRGRQCCGRDPQWLPVRPDGTAHAADRRPGGVRGGDRLAGRRVVVAGVPGRGRSWPARRRASSCRRSRPPSPTSSAARRARDSGGGGADDVRSGRDRRLHDASVGSPSS